MKPPTVARFADFLNVHAVLDPRLRQFLFARPQDIECRSSGRTHLSPHFPAITRVGRFEISPPAAGVARSPWIGQIQWDLRNSGGYNKDPILDTLERIECRDALINPDGTESVWPPATVMSNPVPLEERLGLVDYVTHSASSRGRNLGADSLLLVEKPRHISRTRNAPGRRTNPSAARTARFRTHPRIRQYLHAV